MKYLQSRYEVILRIMKYCNFHCNIRTRPTNQIKDLELVPGTLAFAAPCAARLKTRPTNQIKDLELVPGTLAFASLGCKSVHPL